MYFPPISGDAKMYFNRTLRHLLFIFSLKSIKMFRYAYIAQISSHQASEATLQSSKSLYIHIAVVYCISKKCPLFRLCENSFKRVCVFFFHRPLVNGRECIVYTLPSCHTRKKKSSCFVT